MFGTLRFLLALLVVIYHLTSPKGPIGYLAVETFYIISGYLMTAVTQTKYGYSPLGFLRFISNRALRLYPIYWVVLSATYIYSGVTVGEVIPTSLLDSCDSFFGFHTVAIKPAWSLRVEGIYYILIGLGLSGTFKRTLTWVGLAVVMTLISCMYVDRCDYAERYFSVASALLPFGLGCLAWWLRHVRGKALIGTVGAACMIYSLITITDVKGVAFTWYLNTLGSTLLVIALGKIKAPKWDTEIGELSYSLYLIHYAVGTLVVHDLLHVDYGWLALLYALPISLAAAILLDKYVGRPIERFRHTIARTALNALTTDVSRTAAGSPGVRAPELEM